MLRWGYCMWYRAMHIKLHNSRLIDEVQVTSHAFIKSEAALYRAATLQTIL